MTYQRAKYADMTKVEMHVLDTQQSQRLQHQLLYLQIAFQTVVSIQLGTDLQKLTAARQSDRLSVQHAPGIAQPCHTLMIEQMGVDARRLRRDVCS